MPFQASKISQNYNKKKERSRIRIMSNNLLPSQPICYSGLERVSLSVSQLLRRFSDDRQKGSVTAEAAVAVPVFFLAVVTMLYLLEMMAVHTAVRSGLQYAEKKQLKKVV